MEKIDNHTAKDDKLKRKSANRCSGSITKKYDPKITIKKRKIFF